MIWPNNSFNWGHYLILTRGHPDGHRLLRGGRLRPVPEGTAATRRQDLRADSTAPRHRGRAAEHALSTDSGHDCLLPAPPRRTGTGKD
jgi:hypothetical protein